MIQVGERPTHAPPALQQTSDRPPQLSLAINEHSGVASGHSVKCHANTGDHSLSGSITTAPKTSSELAYVPRYLPTEPRIRVIRRGSYESVEFSEQVEEGLYLMSRSQPINPMLGNVLEVWGVTTSSPIQSRRSSPTPISRSVSPDPLIFFRIGQLFTNPQTPPEPPLNGYFYPSTNIDQSQSCPDIDSLSDVRIYRRCMTETLFPSRYHSFVVATGVRTIICSTALPCCVTEPHVTLCHRHPLLDWTMQTHVVTSTLSLLHHCQDEINIDNNPGDTELAWFECGDLCSFV